MSGHEMQSLELAAPRISGVTSSRNPELVGIVGIGFSVKA